MTEWIKCSDRLPPLDLPILLFDIDIYTGYLSAYGSYHINCNCREGSDCEPTHWAELPEPPSEDS